MTQRTYDILARRLDAGKVLVLDGGMGTMLMHSCNTPLRVPDELCVNAPEEVFRVHRAYLDAGADILTTNTFNANTLTLNRMGLPGQAAKICQEAVRIARMAVYEYCAKKGGGESKRPMIAGDIGPMSGAPFEIAEAAEEAAASLITAGADLLLIETVCAVADAEATFAGVQRTFKTCGREVPVMVSATISIEGKLPSGEEIGKFVNRIEPFNPFFIGVNCSMGTQTPAKYIRELGELTSKYISFSPSAGMPDANGVYHCTPREWAEYMKGVLCTSRVNLVGGCCGTSPEYIRLMTELLAKSRDIYL